MRTITDDEINAVRNAHEYYEKTFTGYYEPTTDDFIRKMEVNFGITLYKRYDLGMDHFRDKITIVDEQKYLVFMLKYAYETS